MPSWSMVHGGPPILLEIDPARQEFWIEDARGWPCLGMYGRLRCMVSLGAPGPNFWANEAEAHQGLLVARPIPQGQYISDGFEPVCVLPMRPIWPGFAINTLFYAAIVWGVFAAPFALRRRRRIKRGLCPKCAYPIGSSDVCTECGKPLTRQSVTISGEGFPCATR